MFFYQRSGTGRQHQSHCLRRWANLFERDGCHGHIPSGSQIISYGCENVPTKSRYPDRVGETEKYLATEDCVFLQMTFYPSRDLLCDFIGFIEFSMKCFYRLNGYIFCFEAVANHLQGTNLYKNNHFWALNDFLHLKSHQFKLVLYQQIFQTVIMSNRISALRHWWILDIRKIPYEKKNST